MNITTTRSSNTPPGARHGRDCSCPGRPGKRGRWPTVPAARPDRAGLPIKKTSSGRIRACSLYKLHGSSGWADHINPKVMILGDNKARDIGLFPVLSHYFEQFETALAASDARLMIIGYGFRDRHINEVLVRSVIEHGMKFSVVDPLGADIARAVNPTANAPIPGRPATWRTPSFKAAEARRAAACATSSDQTLSSSIK